LYLVAETFTATRLCAIAYIFPETQSKGKQVMAASRNRQQFWWNIHLVIFFIFLGIIAGGLLPISVGLGKTLAVAWLGLLIMHTLTFYYGREAVKDKPKRQVRLSDDGELIEVGDIDTVLSDDLAALTQADVHAHDQMR
jgi:hypothetical protein